MMETYNSLSTECSRLVTRRYSTSFSWAVRTLHPRFRDAIYSIYGFVRLADEVVDTFHEYDKSALLKRLREDTDESVKNGISLNPILNSFQHTARKFNIGNELIGSFLDSMEMDLQKTGYDRQGFDEYIYGSAEVVGLMCLRVFCDGDEQLYDQLKLPARSLGAAFQKVNFLRDMQSDHEYLGRIYFPQLDISDFTDHVKKQIEAEIEGDFLDAGIGIAALPAGAHFGVHLAYLYYYSLFKKIQRLPAHSILQGRVRLPDARKYALFIRSFLGHRLGLNRKNEYVSSY